ncbi:MAG TPA: dipicolinate synthase subunit DpsA [Tissierellia bacterium]|nr:dipicolinate synthase subunit DpsA [Tissierellia bacterium]
MKRRSVMVLGGDRRNLELARLLINDGEDVKISYVHGLNFEDIDLIIGPLPLSSDKKTLNAPFHPEEIEVDALLEKMRGKTLIAGVIDEELILKGSIYGITMVDYFKREELQVLNAVPTAEGAIKIAIENMPITLHGSNALVLGFGRIGKALSNMLYGMGANVHVAARKHEDIAWIKNLRYIPVCFDELDTVLQGMDVLFNTVPQLVLDDNRLIHLNREALVIDLASQPGGVDFGAAEKLGIKTIHALGIPGKTAPLTAARIIKETIYNIIRERGL